MKNTESLQCGFVSSVLRTAAIAALLSGILGHVPSVRADTTPLAILAPTLQVTVEIDSGLNQPIGIVFLGANDYFVLEKASGQVKRVLGGVLQPTPLLDLQ